MKQKQIPYRSGQGICFPPNKNLTGNMLTDKPQMFVPGQLRNQLHSLCYKLLINSMYNITQSFDLRLMYSFMLFQQ